MNDQARIEAYFDRVADSFDAIYSGKKPRVLRAWDRLTRRNLTERLQFTLDALSPLSKRRVLDVGCGSGRYGVVLVKQGAAEVVGIDLSARMLTIARDLAREQGVEAHCQFVQSDVVSFRPDLPFDDAVAMGFFDYTREPETIVRALHGLVRERLVASFPARWSPRVPFRALYLTARGCPVCFYDAASIRALLTCGGFAVRELKRSGPIYLVVAQATPPPV